jgi:hypothetical protein
MPGAGGAASYAVGMTAIPGDPHAVPDDVVYCACPMDEDAGWQVGQGFHGGFSHDRRAEPLRGGPDRAPTARRAWPRATVR